MLRPFPSTEAFQYRRSSIELTKSATFPSNGLFTLANSMAIALLVALDLILAMGMIVRSLPLGEYLSFSLVLSADTIVVESAQIGVHRSPPHASVLR